jgi:hypothetical protein
VGRSIDEVDHMNPSHTFDPELHEPGSPAARGQCSHHASQTGGAADCAGEAVVSFQDRAGQWQSGCRLALEQLVAAGEIEPLGQGA